MGMRKLKEAKTIVDERGVMIVMLEPMGHKDDVQYFGVAKVMLPVGSEEIRLPIPASSLDEAFDKYDSELQRFSEDFQKQMASNAKVQQDQQTQET
jgi:hypothetical protein